MTTGGTTVSTGQLGLDTGAFTSALLALQQQVSQARTGLQSWISNCNAALANSNNPLGLSSNPTISQILVNGMINVLNDTSSTQNIMNGIISLSVKNITNSTLNAQLTGMVSTISNDLNSLLLSKWPDFSNGMNSVFVGITSALAAPIQAFVNAAGEKFDDDLTALQAPIQNLSTNGSSGSVANTTAQIQVLQTTLTAIQSDFANQNALLVSSMISTISNSNTSAVGIIAAMQQSISKAQTSVQAFNTVVTSALQSPTSANDRLALQSIAASLSPSSSTPWIGNATADLTTGLVTISSQLGAIGIPFKLTSTGFIVNTNASSLTGTSAILFQFLQELSATLSTIQGQVQAIQVQYLNAVTTNVTQVSTIQNQLNNAQSQSSTSQGSVNALSMTNLSLSDQNIQLTSINKALSVENQTLAARLNTISTQLNAAQVQNSALQTQLQNTQSNLQSAQQENSSIQRNLQALEANLQAVDDQLEQAQSQNTAAQIQSQNIAFINRIWLYVTVGLLIIIAGLILGIYFIAKNASSSVTPAPETTESALKVLGKALQKKNG